jgi:cyclopropane fatty-acyl-phospholipid synthase-like methyltransferase
MTAPDKSNGYEQIAPIFISGRGQNHVGVGARVVAEWSHLLQDGATVLDVGCGTGVPISETLIKRGFDVYGIDASPSMVAAFQARFPTSPVQCAAAEDSDFFNRNFDAVVAWGLFFLLDPEVQRRLLKRLAALLPSGGRLLFTAPRNACSWSDAMTEQTSVSLGFDQYQAVLESSGMLLVETHLDEGENHYYSSQKS